MARRRQISIPVMGLQPAPPHRSRARPLFGDEMSTRGWSPRGEAPSSWTVSQKRLQTSRHTQQGPGLLSRPSANRDDHFRAGVPRLAGQQNHSRPTESLSVGAGAGLGGVSSAPKVILMHGRSGKPMIQTRVS